MSKVQWEDKLVGHPGGIPGWRAATIAIKYSLAF
jgi:hypothetical protein